LKNVTRRRRGRGIYGDNCSKEKIKRITNETLRGSMYSRERVEGGDED
jgi:hypothetical protein